MAACRCKRRKDEFVPTVRRIGSQSYNVQFKHFMKLGIVADRNVPLDAMWCALCAAMWHSYYGTGYANPHAPTQIANGLSTTTLQYDNDGNVIQKTVDGTTTTYVYDYANRLIALGVGGATTTHGYDALKGIEPSDFLLRKRNHAFLCCFRARTYC